MHGQTAHLSPSLELACNETYRQEEATGYLYTHLI